MDEIIRKAVDKALNDMCIDVKHWYKNDYESDIQLKDKSDLENIHSLDDIYQNQRDFINAYLGIINEYVCYSLFNIREDYVHSEKSYTHQFIMAIRDKVELCLYAKFNN